MRLPEGLGPDRPGGLVQLNTVFVELGPGNLITPFTAYGPVAK